MSRLVTYPSFLRTREGGFLQTNDALVDGALRKRLTRTDRRRLDRIVGGISPDRLAKLKARLAIRALPSGAETERNAPTAGL